MKSWTFPLSTVLLLLLGGFFLGFSGGVDDAHITYWAAESLVRNGEILNYNLDRVEQSSSLLQVLVLGVLRTVAGVSVVVLGHVLTLIVSILVLFLFCRLLKKLQINSKATLLLASSPFFVYWAFGGMEGVWLGALLLLLIASLATNLARPHLSLGVVLLSLAIQMTRPEMPLVLCVFAAALLLLRWVYRQAAWPWRSLWIFLLLQTLIAVLLSAWRYWYFGDFFPQPVSAKAAGFSVTNLSYGLQYVQQTWLNLWLLPTTVLVVAGVFYATFFDRRPHALLAVLLATIYSGFVVVSGGDWMAAGRFWTPVLPLFCLLIGLMLDRLLKNRALYRMVLTVLVALNVTYLWRGTAIDFNGIPLWKKTVLTAADHPELFSFFERHARENLHDIPVTMQAESLLGKIIALREMQGDTSPVVMMAGQMGMVPFYLTKAYAEKIRFIDRNGITERTLTACSAAAGLARTRNGLGVGYEWIVAHRSELEKACGFVMPDVVFDIEAGWNKNNINALERAGYVFVYRQRGHVFDGPDNALLPLRKIGAGEFLAVSQTLWQQLGSPAPIKRVF